jgi:DNA polymerase II
MDHGFILQPTYRVENGVPVLHLFGVLEGGESFVYRDTRQRPSFFIPTRDIQKAEPILDQSRLEYGAREELAGVSEPFPHFGENPWRSMAGEQLSELFVPLPPDVPPLRGRLWGAGIECFEADIPFATRYLAERLIRGSLGLNGDWRKGRLINRIYENSDLTPLRYEPELVTIAIDIETDLQMRSVYAISFYGHLPHGGRVAEAHYVVDPAHDKRPISVESGQVEGFCHEHRDEQSLLRAFQRRLREIDPDVITGWNVISFDLKVLQAAFERHRIPFYIGRADMPCRVLTGNENWMTARASVFGRVVVDGIDLVRSAFVKLDQYTLETAARTILGEGKLFKGAGRGLEIERSYRDDLESFLSYNLTDSRLVIEILEKLDLIQLAISRSLLTGLPMDRVAGSIAAFDFLYLGPLHEKGIAAPSVISEEYTAAISRSIAQELAGDEFGGEAGESDSGHFGTGSHADADTGPRVSPSRPMQVAVGGTVLDSKPGIYDNVWLFDYQSLYPSIIRTFRIDPLGYHMARNSESDQGVITAPNGAQFARGEGILPQILEELFPRRAAAKERGEQVVQTAIKIIMNSLYGVLATPRCRYYSTDISNGITYFGGQILLWTRERLEEMGYEVIYGDTDSVFAISGISDPDAAAERGREVVSDLNRQLTEWVTKEHGVQSHLKLEYERLYLKFFMPTQRHSREGSKKRYAGLILDRGEQELVFTGLESVRRDWTVLAKDFQRHLLLKVFNDEPVDGFIREFVRELTDGERDGDLIYRKALRKPLAEYGKTTPPHVKAARLIPGQPGKLISYVITVEGPQPVGHVTAALDYEHYKEKQIRPVAESILFNSDMSFDEILGKGKQLGFF